VPYQFLSAFEAQPVESTLPLLVAGVPLADDPNDTAAAHHLAVFTDRLDAASDLHRDLTVRSLQSLKV
jgi:hypothetical protein